MSGCREMPLPVKRACLLVVLVAAVSTWGWKKEVHFITLPLIEASGLYTSIRCLQDTRSSATQVPSIATIGFLALNDGLGACAVFGPQEYYPVLHAIHRVVGYGVSMAALWMTVAAANDRDVNNLTRNISYGYTMMSAVPIVIFSF